MRSKGCSRRMGRSVQLVFDCSVSREVLPRAQQSARGCLGRALPWATATGNSMRASSRGQRCTRRSSSPRKVCTRA
jgi:hypothetical protein